MIRSKYDIFSSPRVREFYISAAADFYMEKGEGRGAILIKKKKNSGPPTFL